MDFIEDYIDLDPLLSGVILILISVIWITIMIGRKTSFRMKDYSAMSWKVILSQLLILSLLFIRGIILIIRNF